MRGAWGLPQIAQSNTDAMRGDLSKNTDITDAHGSVFSRILYSCSASYCLVFDAPPAQWIATDFSHAEGALRSEKSVEICGICGQQLSAQCAKEQAGCFYSPTDRADKHRYHAGCFYQKTRDPSGRRQDGTGWAEWAVGAMRFRAHLPIGRLGCRWVRARCGGSCGGGCSSRGSSGARGRRWVPR